MNCRHGIDTTADYCAQCEVDETRRQVADLYTEITRLKEEIATLRADAEVMAEAEIEKHKKYVAEILPHHDRIIIDGHYYSVTQVKQSLTAELATAERIKTKLLNMGYGNDDAVIQWINAEFGL